MNGLSAAMRAARYRRPPRCDQARLAAATGARRISAAMLRRYADCAVAGMCTAWRGSEHGWLGWWLAAMLFAGAAAAQRAAPTAPLDPVKARLVAESAAIVPGQDAVGRSASRHRAGLAHLLAQSRRFRPADRDRLEAAGRLQRRRHRLAGAGALCRRAASAITAIAARPICWCRSPCPGPRARRPAARSRRRRPGSSAPISASPARRKLALRTAGRRQPRRRRPGRRDAVRRRPRPPAATRRRSSAVSRRRRRSCACPCRPRRSPGSSGRTRRSFRTTRMSSTPRPSRNSERRAGGIELVLTARRAARPRPCRTRLTASWRCAARTAPSGRTRSRATPAPRGAGRGCGGRRGGRRCCWRFARRRRC